MSLSPEQITIAVTVYRRSQFVLDAVRSALEQTVPVRVMVVEDCGPDPVLRESVTGAFGNRIEYIRNPRNRGLVDNWNACMEYCKTPWLSILHDDDLLHPNFIEEMLVLSARAPGRTLYFGQTSELIEGGHLRPAPKPLWKDNWRQMDAMELADRCVVMFAGQLFCVAAARSVGGFCPRYYFTGDWDMWFRLHVYFGAAQSGTEVSVVRSHWSDDRGTSQVERNGYRWALDNVQRKRNQSLLRKQPGWQRAAFERTKVLAKYPVPATYLLRCARGFSGRLLRYNVYLFLHSHPPHLRYAALQWMGRLFGARALQGCSVVWNHLRRY